MYRPPSHAASQPARHPGTHSTATQPATCCSHMLFMTFHVVAHVASPLLQAAVCFLCCNMLTCTRVVPHVVHDIACARHVMTFPFFRLTHFLCLVGVSAPGRADHPAHAKGEMRLRALSRCAARRRRRGEGRVAPYPLATGCACLAARGPPARRAPLGACPRPCRGRAGGRDKNPERPPLWRPLWKGSHPPTLSLRIAADTRERPAPPAAHAPEPPTPRHNTMPWGAYVAYPIESPFSLFRLLVRLHGRHRGHGAGRARRERARRAGTPPPGGGLAAPWLEEEGPCWGRGPSGGTLTISTVGRRTPHED